jgi:hypothetical protein
LSLLTFAALAINCGNGAATSVGDTPAGARSDGLDIGPPLSLRQNVAAARGCFHAVSQGLAAMGRAHQVAFHGSVAEVRSLPAAALRRQRIQTALRTFALPAAGTGDAQSQRRALASALQVARGADGPALRLQTLSIGRAGFECVQGAAPAALAADGAAVRALAGCSERWTNDQQGAEVAFQFPARPSGSGDLVVSVRAQLIGAAAPPAVTSDARGLHFTAAGATPFVYGHATWVDATGRQTAVQARWTGAAIELAVPAGVVESSRYPAVLDPVVGPDLGTDHPPLVPASAGLDPDVGFDGTNFLVVFEDFARIRAVRADPNGNVLDAPWLDLGDDTTQQFEPAVAFGGGHYLVTWWQDDATAESVHARMINPDGTLVGTAGVTVSAEDAIDDAVAWNGQSFLVSWTGFGDPPGIRVAQVDSNGAVVAGSQRSLSNTGAFVGHPRIGTGTNVDALAWEDGNNTGDFTNRMFAGRLGRDGTVLDPAGVRLSANESDETQVKLASAGDSFLIAWRREATPSTIQGTVLGDDGALRAEDFTISRSTGLTSLPAVVFDGARYLVAWEDERDVPAVFGALVATDGTALSAEDTKLSNVTVGNNFDQTALAWNGSRYLVVFQGERVGADGSVSAEGIEGSLVAPDLTTDGTSHSFTQLPTGELAPSVVWDGQDYVVTWFDERTGSDQETFRAVRITTGGQVLDPDGIVLSGDDHGVSASIASNGAGASSVVWSSPQGGSFERPLAADGTVGAIQPLFGAPLIEPPVVAGNGRSYLALASTQGATVFTLDLLAQFVRPDGTLGTPFAVQSEVDSPGGSVVATGLDYLVGALQNNAGEVIPISRFGRIGSPIPLATSSSSISAANNGRNTLVSWMGTTNFAPTARLFDNGAFRGRTLQLAPSGAGFPTALAWDGRTYWAVWDGDFINHLPFIRQVSASGVLGPSSQLLAEECQGPALASNGRRQLLLACFQFSDHFRVVRVSTRLIQTP